MASAKRQATYDLGLIVAGEAMGIVINGFAMARTQYVRQNPIAQPVQPGDLSLLHRLYSKYLLVRPGAEKWTVDACAQQDQARQEPLWRYFQ